MSKSKFYTLKRSSSGYGFTAETGDLICISKFKFGVYKSFITQNERLQKIWYVVELESGMSLASAETKQKAIERARNKLSSISPVLFGNKITESIKRYGRSPLYQEGLNLDEN